jgi:Na+-transporting NADH:ubiquinone oxidoreductase subunit C
VVSLVCSVLVATAAVVLQPRQLANEANYRQRIVLEVAGIYAPDSDIAEQFAVVDMRMVDLQSGEYVADVGDEESVVNIPDEQDVAGLKQRPAYAPVYLIRDEGTLNQVILPVYGQGLWSTMYGYLSLEADGRTIRGLRFYQHAETPGLGDQIERADWLAEWPGKQLFDAAGDLRIEVVRGQASEGADAIHQVDGLSGATLTGRGVSNLLRYWTGPHGFGPYLQKIHDEANTDG